MATETSSLLELNLSTFEYRELSNQAMDRMGVSMDFITQIIFAMLIASFFIAHRLSRSQLILVMSLYSLLVALNLYIFCFARSRVGRIFSRRWFTCGCHRGRGVIGSRWWDRRYFCTF